MRTRLGNNATCNMDVRISARPLRTHQRKTALAASAEDRSNSTQRKTAQTRYTHVICMQRKTAQTRHSGRPLKLDTAEDRSNSTHQRKTALACFQLPIWTLHHISLPTGSRCRTAHFITYHLDMTYALRTWSIHNLNTKSPARNTGSTMASNKICT